MRVDGSESTASVSSADEARRRDAETSSAYVPATRFAWARDSIRHAERPAMLRTTTTGVARSDDSCNGLRSPTPGSSTCDDLELVSQERQSDSEVAEERPAKVRRSKRGSISHASTNASSSSVPVATAVAPVSTGTKPSKPAKRSTRSKRNTTLRAYSETDDTDATLTDSNVSPTGPPSKARAIENQENNVESRDVSPSSRLEKQPLQTENVVQKEAASIGVQIPVSDVDSAVIDRQIHERVNRSGGRANEKRSDSTGRKKSRSKSRTRWGYHLSTASKHEDIIARILGYDSSSSETLCASHLKSCFNDPYYSDIKVLFGSRKYDLHSMILHQCSYFRSYIVKNINHSNLPEIDLRKLGNSKVDESSSVQLPSTGYSAYCSIFNYFSNTMRKPIYGPMSESVDSLSNTGSPGLTDVTNGQSIKTSTASKAVSSCQSRISSEWTADSRAPRILKDTESGKICLEIVSRDLSQEGVEVVLREMYGFSGQITADNVLDVLTAACFFDMKTLSNKCMRIILEEALKPETVIQYVFKIDKLPSYVLKEKLSMLESVILKYIIQLVNYYLTDPNYKRITESETSVGSRYKNCYKPAGVSFTGVPPATFIDDNGNQRTMSTTCPYFPIDTPEGLLSMLPARWIRDVVVSDCLCLRSDFERYLLIKLIIKGLGQDHSVPESSKNKRARRDFIDLDIVYDHPRPIQRKPVSNRLQTHNTDREASANGGNNMGILSRLIGFLNMSTGTGSATVDSNPSKAKHVHRATDRQYPANVPSYIDEAAGSDSASLQGYLDDEEYYYTSEGSEVEQDVESESDSSSISEQPRRVFRGRDRSPVFRGRSAVNNVHRLNQQRSSSLSSSFFSSLKSVLSPTKKNRPLVNEASQTTPIALSKRTGTHSDNTTPAAGNRKRRRSPSYGSDDEDYLRISQTHRNNDFSNHVSNHRFGSHVQISRRHPSRDADLSSILENAVIYTYMNFSQINKVKCDGSIPAEVVLRSFWFQAELENKMRGTTRDISSGSSSSFVDGGLSSSPSTEDLTVGAVRQESSTSLMDLGFTGKFKPFRFTVPFASVGRGPNRSRCVTCCGRQYRVQLTAEETRLAANRDAPASQNNNADERTFNVSALLQRSRINNVEPFRVAYKLWCFDRRKFEEGKWYDFDRPIITLNGDGKGEVNPFLYSSTIEEALANSQSRMQVPQSGFGDSQRLLDDIQDARTQRERCNLWIVASVHFE